MNEQRTPDELATENALICVKLLGLTKHCDAASCPDWRTADGKRFWSNPTFDNWSDATLVLNALQRIGADAVPWRRLLGVQLTQGLLDPESIRDAALQYIRSLP